MDDASDMENKKLRLKLLQKYIGECFSGRKDYEVKSVPHEVNIDWAPYESVFNIEEMACFRALSRIAFFLARKPYEQLLTGYEFDLTNAIIYKTEKEIMDYFTLIAGCFGAMCVYSFMYRFSIDKYDFVEKDDYVIKKAYHLGNVSKLEWCLN